MLNFKTYGFKKGKCEILNILGPSLDTDKIPNIVYGRFPLVNIKVNGEWESAICMMGVYYTNLDPKKHVIIPLASPFHSGRGFIYPEISFTTQELACEFFKRLRVISNDLWEEMRNGGVGDLCKDKTFRCYDHV